MRKRKTIIDDGFQAYLTEGAMLVGGPGIPMLMPIDNSQIPKDLVPFSKINTCKSKRQYVHFYQYDNEFSRVLTATERYLDVLKLFDGVITPDCSMLIGQAPCLQQTNTYMNRAVGFYLQKNGIPIIPNVRWSDKSSFTYCFLGIPWGSTVSISTHGCITGKKEREIFKSGLDMMLNVISPSNVIVHGYMPDDIFGDYKKYVDFHRYMSEFERTHKKEGA